MKLIGSLIAAAVISAIAGPALAQATASVNASGSVTIIAPIAISKAEDLKFGTIVRPASGSGTVAVDATGQRSFTGTVVGITSTVTAASFDVTGEPNHSYEITVPASMTMTGPSSATLAVTLSPSKSGATSFDSSGADNFTVGGSFGVSNTTPTGAYTGTFTTTVAYE